jgi:protein O-mannosyl-transferase
LSTPTEVSARIHARALALLALAVIAAYANALGGQFQFDDYNVIVDNPVVHGLGAWWADLGHGLRPLLKLSYALNWAAGPEAWTFLLVNAVIHGLNAALVYGLAVEWQRAQPGSAGPPPATARGALLAALLFALHPAQTEAVTYVSGRSVSLMALFYLAGVLAHARGAHRGSLVLFAAALATKEVAATFPVALLLWDVTTRGPSAWRASLRRQLPHWALLLVLGTAMLLRSRYGEFFAVSLDTRSPWENFVTQAGGIMYLIRQLALPLWLNIDPDLPEPTSLTPGIALQGAVLLALVAAGLAAIRRRPLAALALLWFFLHLAPTNSVFARIDVANDRQLYLPAVGVFIALGALLARAAARGTVAARAALVIASLGVAVLGGLTVARNADYRDEVTLWRQTARLSPEKPRVHNNLGHALRLAGCPEQAQAAFTRALELDPDYGLARNNLDRLARERRLGIAGNARC